LLLPRACREGLASQDPDTRSPSRGVAEDEETCRDDQEITGTLFRGITGDTDGGVGEQPSGLPDTTNDEWPAATKAFHHLEPVSDSMLKDEQGNPHPDTEEGAAEVDTAEDELRLERILQADVDEDGSSVIEEVVR